VSVINTIKCAWPPKIYTLFGVRYIAGGDHCIEVPLDTKSEDVSKYMVWDGRETLVSVPTKIKTKLANCDDVEEWSVKILSSNKKDEYHVSLKNEHWSCSCIGYSFKHRCSHIEKAKETRARIK
jgi:hypothetical protein